MTATKLLHALKEFVQEQTEDMRLPLKSTQAEEKCVRAPEVWLMRLPDMTAETKKAPYILLQLVTGADEQEPQQMPVHSCIVRIVICAYSEHADEGALWVLDIIERLRLQLLRQRIIANQFTLQMPMEYLIYPDSDTPKPFYFGEMMTVWELPKIMREVP